MFYALVLPFGGALAARLRHEIWPVWVVWGGCSLIAIIALWIGDDFGPALFWTLAASALGFLGPEIWTSCRGFMSHPRVFGWIMGIGVLLFLVRHQDFLGGLLTLGLIALALRVMLSPFLRRRHTQSTPRGERRH